MSMSVAQNKAQARRLVEEIFNRGNLAVIDELVSPDFVERELLPPGTPAGREGVKQLTVMFRSAFPDFKVTIDDAIGEGDRVVIRETWTGTQRGEFMGIPSTGKHVSFGVIDILRFAGGKIVEHWGQMDSMGLMTQLGAIPTPG
jgi:steroid delta-isomerase-like uncharacterized protein